MIILALALAFTFTLLALLAIVFVHRIQLRQLLVVEDAADFAEFAIDQGPEARRNGQTTSGEFDTHRIGRASPSDAP